MGDLARHNLRISRDERLEREFASGKKLVKLDGLEDPHANMAFHHSLVLCPREALLGGKLVVDVLLVLNHIRLAGKHTCAGFVICGNVNDGQDSSWIQETAHFMKDTLSTTFWRLMECIPE